MTRIVSLEALRRSEVSALFEGAAHGGVPISVFVTTWPPGRGPRLHRHPYAEVFLVQAGEATFTVGGDDTSVSAEHVVVVPAETPHRFTNSGAGELRVVSIQPNPTVVQTDLD